MTWTQFVSQISNQVALFGPLLDRARPLDRPTVFVDGGANYCEESMKLSLGAVPTIRVGDGDSSSHGMDEPLPARKDFSDLGFVLRGLPSFVQRVDMFGFLGGRRDHELANFGEAHRFLLARPFATVNFHDSLGIKVVGCRGNIELDIQGVFSVMTFAPSNVHISGDCQYKYDGRLDTVESLGLSNVGHGRVTLGSDSACFVFLN